MIHSGRDEVTVLKRSLTLAVAATVMMGCMPQRSSLSGSKPALPDSLPMLAFAEYSFPIQKDGLPASPTDAAFNRDVSSDPEEKLIWRRLVGLRPALTFGGTPLSTDSAMNWQQRVDPHTGAVQTQWRQTGIGSIFVSTRGLGLHFESIVQVTPDADGLLEGTCIKTVATGIPPGQGFTDLSLGFGEERSDTGAAPCGAGQPCRITFRAKFSHKGSEPTEPHVPKIVLDGPPKDQAAIDNLIFQVTGYSGGLGPFGLTNSRYFGHVFWDADVWILPALALLDPEAARRIPAYRLATVQGAEKNYRKWIAANRPVAEGGNLGPASPVKGALKFAWESGSTGVETAPGDSRYQDHVSGSVVLGMRNASALNLVDEQMADEVVAGVHSFYEQRIAPHNKMSGRWSLPAVMSPDEFHLGDNDIYTNFVAQQAPFRSKSPQRTDWRWSKPLLVPKDDQGRLLNYEGDREKGYQQAAGLLAVFPLQNPMAEAQAISMLDRFGPKVIASGPAMSHSLHALIRARFGSADEAHAEWRSAYDRYAKPPFDLISERPTTNQTVFVTGAAGFLNTVVYGFCGIRVGETAWPDAQWKLPLKNGWWISGRANLPTTWRSLKIEDLRILGRSYTLTATPKGSTLSPN